MIGAKVTLSSARTGAGRNDWQTPSKVLDVVRRFDSIGIDVATSQNNPTVARYFCTEKKDEGRSPAVNWGGGLGGPWHGFGLAFSNPPYSDSKLWIAKAVAEADQGAEIVMLIASRTGAKYFAPVYDADALCFVRGRLTFNDADTGEPVRDGKGRPMPAPFDSAIVYWGTRPARFRRHFSELGIVLYPRQIRGMRNV